MCREYTVVQPSRRNPFRFGPLGEHIGLEVTSKMAVDILNGSYLPDPLANFLQEIKDIISSLGKPLNITTNHIEAKISAADFIATYKVVREDTFSSPSGWHVGHHKAATADPTLSELHSQMMSIPYQAGFSPKRWRQVTDIMLEKKPGEPKVHCLRIIALQESDYNANWILFARLLSLTLEDNGISSVQYGSRPGKLCTSAVLNKQLTFDIIQQTKGAAFIENDAIGCYDRLVNALLLLQLKKGWGSATSNTIIESNLDYHMS
jgi:hypothetical protein